MAGTTTKGLRFPQNADAPNIAADFQNLASDVDTELDDYVLKSGGIFTANPQVPTGIIFEGATADSFELALVTTDPTADRTITLPDRTGTIITSGDTATVSATMLVDTYQTTASAATAATTAQDFSRTSVLMLGGM
jgi:hypothetical protein